jgi:hypothetical protein
MFAKREYLQDALHDWIEKVLAEAEAPCEIVWDYTGGSRAKAPFIALQFIGNERPGFPYRGKVDPETGERRLHAPERVTVSINGFGESSFDRLDAICDSIFKAEYISFLKKKKLVVNKITDVHEAANEIAGVNENHGLFDISVSFIRIITENPGWIEHVGVKTDLPANPDISV